MSHVPLRFEDEHPEAAGTLVKVCRRGSRENSRWPDFGGKFVKRLRRRFGFEQRQDVIKVGRNEKCPCGSGKKYKKCCMEV